MTDWDRIKKLKSVCDEQWREVKGRLGELGIEFRPWPGPALTCYRWGNKFPLFAKHELEDGNYTDRRFNSLEDHVREEIKALANVVVHECDAIPTSIFYVRDEPRVGVVQGDEYGNWLCVAFRGAASPVANRLTSDQVEAEIKRLGLGAE